MSALADDQTAIFWSVGKKVDQALQTAEAGLERVLVLVRPWLVLWDVLTATICQWVSGNLLRQFRSLGKTEVDRIKGHDQVLGIVHLLESANNARLTANPPDKIFMCD